MAFGFLSLSSFQSGSWTPFWLTSFSVLTLSPWTGSLDFAHPGLASGHRTPVPSKPILTHPVCLALLLDRQLPSQMTFLDSSDLAPHLTTGQLCSPSTQNHNAWYTHPQPTSLVQWFHPLDPVGHHSLKPTGILHVFTYAERTQHRGPC